MIRPYETIEYGVQVSRDHLRNFRARGLRVLIDEKKFGSDYPALVWELGGFFEWLHLDAFVFFSFAPIPKGMVVHHKDENVRNARFENLELKTKTAHRTVHRLAEMKAQEEDFRLGSFWREHAETAPLPVSAETIAEIKKARAEALLLAVPGRPTRKQEELALKMTLEANFESLLERAWPFGSKTRIPPGDKTKSFLDKDVKKERIKAYTRACSKAEAGYIYLLRLHRLGKHDFDYEAAVKYLNAHRPEGLPEIHQATFDRMMGHPRVHEAMKNLRKYERLPVARKAWDPIKMMSRLALTDRAWSGEADRASGVIGVGEFEHDGVMGSVRPS